MIRVRGEIEPQTKHRERREGIWEREWDGFVRRKREGRSLRTEIRGAEGRSAFLCLVPPFGIGSVAAAMAIRVSQKYHRLIKCYF